MISFYPPETRQALFQDLSVALKAILSQRLVRARKGGRVPAVEVLINNRHIADLIERGDVQAIKEALEQSLAPESSSYEQSLYALLQSGLVTRDDALAAADSQNNLLWFINNSGKPQKQRDNAAAPTAPDAASFAEFTLNI